MQWRRKGLQSREMDGKWWGELLEWTGRAESLQKHNKTKNKINKQKQQNKQTNKQTNKQKGFKSLGNLTFFCFYAENSVTN